MYEVIVVGARWAGASLAMLLARAGHRVALVDRASFPSDTMSTHFLWQRGAARLQSGGLLTRLRARGCAPIREITFDVGSVALAGSGPPVGGVADTYCPRRIVLDSLLVEAAVGAGAELIEDFAVRDALWSGGRVAGVSGRSRTGSRSSLTGQVVVGADGLRSTLARAVGARRYREHPPLTGVYYSYWSGLRHLGACFHIRPGRLIIVSPTNDDLSCVYVGWPEREYRRVRQDPEGSFRSALALVPALADAVTAGGREERLVGTGILPNFYRNSAGPGWALAGDAGHHKDPCTAMGMSDAFLAADLLAAAIHDGLTRQQPMEDALASYQRRRDAVTANGYALTLHAARLAPIPARLQAFYQVTRNRPELTRQVFGVLGGSIPAASVYSGARITAALTEG